MLPQEVRSRLKMCISPLIKIVPLVDRLDFGRSRGLIFSSGNAVAIASALTDRRDLPCFCVGARTTACAAAAGWTATRRGSTAGELVRALIDAPPPGPLLHLHGVHTRGDVSGRLTEAGIPAAGQVIYDQELLPLSAEARDVLQGETPVIVPLFSPRSAAHFAAQYGAEAPVFLAALSPAVAECLADLGDAELQVSKTPDSASMSALIEKMVNQVSRVERGRGAQ